MGLGDSEVERFLAHSMVARVAALSPSGRPFMTPLWFASHRGRVHLPTGQTTLVVRYVSAQPSVVLLFDAEQDQPSGRVLRLGGTATVHPGNPSLPVLLRIARKYYLSSVSRGIVAHMRHYSLLRQYYGQGGGPAVLEVAPQAAEFLERP